MDKITGVSTSFLKTNMIIRSLSELPADFSLLLEESICQGDEFIGRLFSEWNSHANRFNKEAEVLLGVFHENGRLIAIGGLNVDPYANDPTIGRVRHVYVRNEFRCRGIGRKLLTEIMNYARSNFRLIRLRTQNKNAANLYRSLGFKETPNSDFSHIYMEIQL